MEDAEAVDFDRSYEIVEINDTVGFFVLLRSVVIMLSINGLS